MSEEPVEPRLVPKVVLTVNQVVAHNLRAARALRGWTQEEAAAHLEPFIGSLWSRANFSAAERSADPSSTRVRNFSADDIVAIAGAFELPVGYFFTPPVRARDVDESYLGHEEVGITTSGGPSFRVDEYMRVTFGSEEGRDHLRARLKELVQWSPSLGDAAQASVESLTHFIDAKLAAVGAYAEDYARNLLDVAALLMRAAEEWRASETAPEPDDTSDPQSAE